MNQQNNNNNQQVVLPRRSRRLATILPASYWISLGYSEVNAQSMEKLQNDLKKYIDGNDESLTIESNTSGVDTLPHHDETYRHFHTMI